MATTILRAAVLFAFVAIISPDCNAYLSEAGIKKTLQMLKSVCTKKYPVEEEVFANMKKGEFPENNNNLNCYFACTFKTMQVVGSKGVIEKKLFKDKMTLLSPPSVLNILMPAIGECAEKDNEELCKSSFNLIKCSYGIDPRVFDFLPI